MLTKFNLEKHQRKHETPGDELEKIEGGYDSMTAQTTK